MDHLGVTDLHTSALDLIQWCLKTKQVYLFDGGVNECMDISIPHQVNSPLEMAGIQSVRGMEVCVALAPAVLPD